MAPEARDGRKLVEIVRLASGTLAKVDVRSLGTVEEPRLELMLSSALALSSADVREARQLVVWRLGLDDDLRPFYTLVADDPVLTASIEHNYGAKGKAAFSMFDAVIDVICAQNTAFRRLYESGQPGGCVRRPIGHERTRRPRVPNACPTGRRATGGDSRVRGRLPRPLHQGRGARPSSRARPRVSS